MDIKIAIVNSSSLGRIFPEHLNRLKALGEVDRFDFPADMKGKELAEELLGYSIIITSATPMYDKAFFEYKDKTLLIARHGIGYNNIDVKAAAEKGVCVTRVPSYVEREAVAESTVALLMDVIRKMRSASIKVKEGEWTERAKFVGYEVKGKTVGIIGFGNIGSRVGQIIKNGFNARLIAYDLNRSPEDIKKGGAEPVSLEKLLKTADIISLNASVTAQSYHMLTDKEFSLMKKGVILIDTARGELINPDSLIKALDDGIIGELAMDAVEGEPIDKDHPLLSYDNVLITPHIGAYTYESLYGMGEKVVKDAEKIIRGEIPDEVVNAR